jgi:hypothetical protein
MKIESPMADTRDSLITSLLESGVSTSATCAAMEFEDADLFCRIFPGADTKSGVFCTNGNHGDLHDDSHTDDVGPPHGDTHDNSHNNYHQDTG